MNSYPVVQTGVDFGLIPHKLSCYIELGGCLQKCKGCHSSYLSIPIAKDLWKPISVITNYIENQAKLGAECVVIMGGTYNRGMDIGDLIELIKALSKVLPVALYSGLPVKSITHAALAEVHELKYIKMGNYIESKGGLASETTNQVMYEHLADDSWRNITNEFWTKESVHKR